MVSRRIVIGDSRNMLEVESESVDLVVTSPPYWNIKDYSVDGQIGYGQTLHEYLKNLYVVWEECFRVLKGGSRICINVGDQFLRSVDYGRYRIVPIHAEITNQCTQIGFDYMGTIIWQKKTTMNTTGGAIVMGSYPYPPNGLIEMDYEYILIYKKLGKKKFSKIAKEKSKLTKDEWKTYFSGHWIFGGARQNFHEAMFPDELPRRLIKMFTFVDDTVLDPFLGSGTTMKAAYYSDRNSIGYELNEKYLPIIQKKVGTIELLAPSDQDLEILEQNTLSNRTCTRGKQNYLPSIQDVEPVVATVRIDSQKNNFYKVIEILDENIIRLNSGLKVSLLGTNNIYEKKNKAKEYLENYVKGKHVSLKFDPMFKLKDNEVQAYLFLKNKIFINKEMIRLGFADISNCDFKYKDKFMKVATEKVNAQRMDIE